MESTRKKVVEAIEGSDIPTEAYDPIPEILLAQTDELMIQTKKLDTLIMHQAYSDPEVTQEIPTYKD